MSNLANATQSSSGMMGLVLTAGGARGAYQAGVLKRMGEIPVFRDKPTPFPIVVGASAGAINSAYIAARSGNFSEATARLAELWTELRIQDVFKTDIPSVGLGASRWIRDLFFGGIVGGGQAQSLLDASPLRKFLSTRLPLEGITESIRAGHLYAVAVSATSYYSGKSLIFIQGKEGHPLWSKSRRSAVSTPLQVEHVLASCAIPIVFQPVLIRFARGEYYFGDGGLRLVTPCSPAIRLGANRVFAIGIRSHAAALVRSRNDLGSVDPLDGRRFLMKQPPLAQVFGTCLNAIFLDHLDTDLDHLRRINELLRVCGAESVPKSELKEPMRRVEAFAIHPSVDLAEEAEKHAQRMPGFVRYLMEGLGTSRSQTADLMSYLLFDSNYTRALVEIGYRDACERIAEIEDFLASAVSHN